MLARLACASLLLGAVQLACADPKDDEGEGEGECRDGRKLVTDLQGMQTLVACGSDTEDTVDTVDGGDDYGEGGTYAGPDEDSSIFPTESSWSESDASTTTVDSSASTSTGGGEASTGCVPVDSGGCVETDTSGSGSSDSGTGDSGTGGSGSGGSEGGRP